MCITVHDTFKSIAPCDLCPKAEKGKVPSGGFRSDRAAIAFSAEYGGVQLQGESWSCL